MASEALFCGFTTGMEEDLDRLDTLESELHRFLKQALADAGATLCATEQDGIARRHIPFRYGGASLGLAVILVGIVPARWLISITGKTIHDPPGDHDVSWLRPLIASNVSQICDSSVRWYDALEDVPMA